MKSFGITDVGKKRSMNHMICGTSFFVEKYI